MLDDSHQAEIEFRGDPYGGFGAKPAPEVSHEESGFCPAQNSGEISFSHLKLKKKGSNPDIRLNKSKKRWEKSSLRFFPMLFSALKRNLIQTWGRVRSSGRCLEGRSVWGPVGASQKMPQFF